MAEQSRELSIGQQIATKSCYTLAAACGLLGAGIMVCNGVEIRQGEQLVECYQAAQYALDGLSPETDCDYDRVMDIVQIPGITHEAIAEAEDRAQAGIERDEDDSFYGFNVANLAMIGAIGTRCYVKYAPRS